MKNILQKYTIRKKTQGKRGAATPIMLSLVAIMTLLAVITTGCSKAKKKTVPKSPVYIRSVPENVNINLISHNKNLGVTPWQASLDKGMYVFEFTKPGYQTTWRKINCNPPYRTDLEVRMEPISSSVIIKTDPAGATLLDGDRVIGETPLFLQDMSLGIHRYTLKKPGFSPREITVKIEDERPIMISEKMVSNIGFLSVTTTPEDANIFINNIPRGKTPANLKLERGEYDLKLELPGYSVHEEKIPIVNDQKSTVNVTLQELPGTITVTTNPPHCELTVNGQQYNNTPTTLTNLKPGEYTIVASHDKYDSSTRTVTIAAGQTLTVDMTLDTNMGGIDLVVHPPGVTIYVDGKKVGLTERGETDDLSKVFEVRGLKSGTHIITLAHKRAEPASVKMKLEIKKGQIRRPKPVRLWIRDTFLKLKDGKTFTGRIAQENKNEILFEPDPTIKIRYDRTQIEELRNLKESE